MTTTEKVLVHLLKNGPSGCASVGAVFGERRGAVVASHGGGDYAAQMLLGRMAKKGLVRRNHSEGSTVWEMTTRGCQIAIGLTK